MRARRQRAVRLTRTGETVRRACGLTRATEAIGGELAWSATFGCERAAGAVSETQAREVCGEHVLDTGEQGARPRVEWGAQALGSRSMPSGSWPLGLRAAAG